MKKKTVLKIVASAMILSLAGVPAVFSAQDDHSHHHDTSKADGGKTASGADPLIEEMIKLDGVFREVVSGVALGDGARVHKALETMHGAMEKTHEGVHAGTVKLKKNADRLEEFVRLDKSFHNDLETLAHASHENDSQKMLSLTKKLLDGCINCHQTFRK